MLSSALLILAFAPLFIGMGLLFPGQDVRRAPSFSGLAAAFWSGWALVIAALQIWQLVYRVDWLALALFVIAAIAGLALAWRGLVGLVRRQSGWQLLLLGGLAVIPALVIANHVLFVPAHTDHGLYHLQTVKWLSDYAIVPGLGNLHHRLAFNNSNFLAAAMLNAGPLLGRSYYLSNTLLAWALIIQCVAGVAALVWAGGRPHDRIERSYLYYALMLAPVVWHMSTTHLPGYSPDVPVFALQAILGGELLRLFELPFDLPEQGLGRFQRQSLYVVLLVCAGITVKLSFIAFGGLVLLAVAGLWIARLRGSQTGQALGKRLAQTWLPWAGIAAVLLLPWLARHAILSGYLLYPSTALPLPVRWRIPLHLAEPIAGVITEWARTASNHITYTGDWAWFLDWARFFVYEARLALLASGALILVDAGLYLGLRKRKPGRAPACFDTPSALLAGIALVSVVYWFELAPDYRFSGAVIWIFLVSTLLFGFQTLVNAGNQPAQGVNSLKPGALGLALVLGLTLWLSPNLFSKNLSLKMMITPPLEPQLAEDAVNSASMQVRETTSGLKVNLPPDERSGCWDLPLPCTQVSDFTMKLRLFDPQDLQKGFYIQMPK